MKLIALLVGLTCVISINSQNCQNINGNYGTCMPLSSCSTLQNASLQFQELSFCNMDRHVCCTADTQVAKFPSDCGTVPNLGLQIVGGHTISPEIYSWIANLEYQNGYQNCAGSVVNGRYVLTAAHCVVDKKIIGLRLPLRNQRTSCDYGLNACDQYQRYRVEAVIVHEHYWKQQSESGGTRLFNDIALLRINRIIEFGQFLKPVCLPFGSPTKTIEEPIADTSLTVAGWGRPDETTYEPAKRAVQVPLWSKDRCSGDENQICAGALGRDSCAGDSGGPLMYEFERHRMVLEGLVSYGPKNCGAPDIAGVYTRVRSHERWIIANMKMD